MRNAAIQKVENTHVEKDKHNAPFLLACSFNDLVSFKGFHVDNGILCLKFPPKAVAENLVTKLQTKTEPRIPSKDIFEATALFWKQVALLKEKNVK